MAAVRDGCATHEAIAGRIYDELPANLRRPAAQTVQAHLVKLRDEGRRGKRTAGGCSSNWRRRTMTANAADAKGYENPGLLISPAELAVRVGAGAETDEAGRRR